jgi:hypothetical protein
MSLFGAGWTLGSIKYLAESGAESVTYYETSGWRGVLETDRGSSRPELFPSFPGSVFPLYHVLADIGEFGDGDIVPASSSQPLNVDGIVLRKEGHTRMLLANYTGTTQAVRLEGTPASVRIRLLDETNAEEAMLEPERYRAHPRVTRQRVDNVLELALLPYAIARIDPTQA